MKKIPVGANLALGFIIGFFALSITHIASAVTFDRDLTVGSEGTDVSLLQNFLTDEGYLVMPMGVATGYFGPITRQALIVFQTAQGVFPTAGFFGPVTRALVNGLTSANDARSDIDSDSRSNLSVTCRTSPTRVKMGELVSFDSTVRGGEEPYRYSWTNGTISSDTDIKIAFVDYGKYAPKITVTDASGATDSDTCPVVTVQSIQNEDDSSDDTDDDTKSDDDSDEDADSSDDSDDVTSAPCYVGGCSSELCTDTPNRVSGCLWRDSYACYGDATCERQSTGQCGWTMDSELQACIANPPRP